MTMLARLAASLLALAGMLALAQAAPQGTPPPVATQLATPRTLSLSGDASGSVAFDGTANVAIPATLANSGVTAGTFGSATQVPAVTVDAKGRITGVALTSITYPVTSVANLSGAITASGLKTALAPVAADIGDSTSTGRAVMTAATPAAARTAIGAVGSTITTMVDVSKTGSQAVTNSFARITFGTVNRDTGSNWDTTNNWYTCPVSGVYLISGMLRVADGTSAGAQFSVGVYTSEADGASWNYWTKVGPTPGTRASFAYSRMSYQSAGDQLRMFSYSDTSGGVTIQNAGLQIILLAQ